LPYQLRERGAAHGLSVQMAFNARRVYVSLLRARL